MERKITKKLIYDLLDHMILGEDAYFMIVERVVRKLKNDFKFAYCVILEDSKLILNSVEQWCCENIDGYDEDELY